MVEIEIGRNEAEQRLDRFLRKYLKGASLSYIYRIIRKDVKVNGKRAAKDTMLFCGDRIFLYLSEEELKRLMDEETWITAEEAMNYGLATGAMEEKEEGISQSAMGYIRKRLLRPEERTEEIKITEDLAEAIADKVMQKAGEFLKKSEQEDSTGWGKFFNESKGE